MTAVTAAGLIGDPVSLQIARGEFLEGPGRGFVSPIEFIVDPGTGFVSPIEFAEGPGQGFVSPIEFLFGHGIAMVSLVDGFDALAPSSPTHGG